MEGDSSCYIYKKKKIKGMEFDQRIKIEKDETVPLDSNIKIKIMNSIVATFLQSATVVHNGFSTST